VNGFRTTNRDSLDGTMTLPKQRQPGRTRADFKRAHPIRTNAAETSLRRVYELLRSSISNGTLTIDQLLVEMELMKALGASRNAVRKALRMLADDGIVSRKTRNGTSLTRDIITVRAGEVGPRAWNGSPDEGRLHVETLDVSRVALPGVLRDRFNTDIDSVLLLEQIGFSDLQPLYVRVSYIPEDFDVEELNRRIDSLHVDYPPLAVAFERFYGQPFGGTHAVVEALRCEERTAELLRIPTGAPVLFQDLTTFDDTGKIREISFAHFRGDRIALSTLNSFSGAVPERGLRPEASNFNGADTAI
jgi:GntR family transcriptional regulator